MAEGVGTVSSDLDSRGAATLHYSIHGLLELRVQTRVGKKSISYLERQLHPFSVSGPLREPDLEVHVEPSGCQCGTQGQRVGKYHVGDDHICWKAGYKLGRWHVAIDGLMSPPVKVLFRGNRFSHKYLFLHVLEPLIDYQMGFSGGLLLHSSGIGHGERGYVFTALTGVGKTNLVLYLLSRGISQFMGDEFLILSEDGHVWNFPVPLSLLRRNLASNPFLKNKLTLPERSRLAVSWLAYALSAGRVKLALSMEVSRLFPNAEIRSRLPLGGLGLLVPTDGSELDVRPIRDANQLVERLVAINSFEFRFFRPALDAYASVYPSSPVASYENRSRDILLRLVERVPCFEIEIPRRFRFEGEGISREMDKVIAGPN